jgi:BirA family biotin operon repressor/biotin-[acetyl-CoA-carboxylase] ligase
MCLTERADRSQWDVLGELTRRGVELPDGLLCLAGSGRGFHGQKGRSWAAVAGNIHLVAHMAPGLTTLEAGVGLSVLPAVAVVDAIDATPGLGGRAGIKWVNDILVDGHKVSGVLARTQTQGQRIGSVVLGIGLNVEAAPEVTPDVFTPRVGCLRDLAQPAEAVTPGRVLAGLTAALERRYLELLSGGLTTLVEAYRGRSLVLGGRVRILPDPPESASDRGVAGRVTAIGDELELHLEGVERPVRTGRLVLES